MEEVNTKYKELVSKGNDLMKSKLIGNTDCFVTFGLSFGVIIRLKEKTSNWDIITYEEKEWSVNSLSVHLLGEIEGNNLTGTSGWDYWEEDKNKEAIENINKTHISLVDIEDELLIINQKIIDLFETLK